MMKQFARLFVTVLSLALPLTASAAVWVKDAATCPTSYQSQDCGASTYACSYSANTLYCDSEANIELAIPAADATVGTAVYSSGLGGGYVFDCVADSGATCTTMATTGWKCQSDSTCSGDYRDTICDGDLNSFTCSTSCQTNRLDCVGDATVGACDVVQNSTNYPTGANNHYGSTCLAADVVCDTNYLDCDATGEEVGNGCEIRTNYTFATNWRYTGCNGSVGAKLCVAGYLDCNASGTTVPTDDTCEIQIGAACTTGGGLPGVYDSTCQSAGVDPICLPNKSYFETGTESGYSTTDPLLWGTQYGTGDLINFQKDGGNAFVVDNAGNVGIGTSTPGALLNLVADEPILRIEQASDASQDGDTAITNGGKGLELVTAGMNTINKYGVGIKFMSSDPQLTTESPKLLAGIYPRATESYAGDTAGGMAIDFATTANAPGTTSVPSVRMTIGQDGSVGIGTTDPSTELEVAGDIGATQYCDEAGANCSTPANLAALVAGGVTLWEEAGGEIYRATGNVGIGTTNPQYKLDVDGALRTAAYGLLGSIYYGNGETIAYKSFNRGNLAFPTRAAGGADPIALISGDGTTYTGGYIKFNTDGAEAMRIDSTGNVGIGTATPLSKLHINGSGSLAEGLSFDSGDTGIYEYSSNMYFEVQGSKIAGFTTLGMFAGAGTTGSAYLLKQVATDTLPSYSFVGDLDTGMGRAGVDQLSLIAGATEIVNVATTGITVAGDITVSGTVDGVDVSNLSTTVTNNTSNISTNTSVLGGKADMVSGATPGNLAGLDANGNLTDSGLVLNDSGTTTSDLWSANKINSVVTSAGTLQAVTDAGATTTNGITFEAVGSLANGLVFGDGDSGIYEQQDDMMTFVTGGLGTWRVAADYAGIPVGNYAQLRRENPTGTNPVFTFYGDESTGIGKAAAEQLSLIAGGVEGIRVNTVASGENYLDVTPSVSGAAVQIATGGANDTNIDLALMPKGTGNVGIGTASPLSKLHIYNAPSGATPYNNSHVIIENDTRSILSLLASNSGDNYIMFGSPASSNRAYFGYTNSTNATPDVFTLKTAGTFNFAGGNVGIGTASPGAKLHVLEDSVNGSIHTLMNVDGDSISAIDAGSGIITEYNGNALFGSVGGYSPGTRTGIGVWGAANSGAPDLFVNDLGNVGIGITTPSEKLDVLGNIAVSGTVDGVDVSALSLSVGTNATNISTNAGDITSLQTGKIDQVASATAGNLAGLDASGNVTDSGFVVNGTTGTGSTDLWPASKIITEIAAVTFNDVDTLDTVVGRGATTATGITVGSLTTSGTISSGAITATGLTTGSGATLISLTNKTTVGGLIDATGGDLYLNANSGVGLIQFDANVVPVSGETLGTSGALWGGLFTTSIVDDGNKVEFANEIIVERSGTAVNASTSNQTILGVTDTSAARTITLATADVIDGRVLIIKDESGGAGTNNITIVTEGSETIDGVSSVEITVDYGVLRVYSNGTNWFSF